MPEATGNPIKVTLPTAQYLFRLYHTPIGQTDTSRLKGSVDADGYVFRPSVNGYELNYNDHLFSIPNTTEAVVATANDLAYAESLLYVNSRIYFIAVWMVEEEKPIDRGSPAIVLTPWHTNPDSYSQVEMLSYRKWPLSPDPVRPFNQIPYFYQLGYDEGNFESYDLTGGEYETYITDPFVVLEVARETDGGRLGKQWFKGVLGVEDYYFDNQGVCKLLDFGSAVQSRFTWFQATLETMQYTHSGWHLKRDGSIKRGKAGYTYRVANLAVDAAQQRRMFLMRSATLQRVYELWWDTCRYVSHALRWIELAGWPESRNIEYPANTTEWNYPYTLCPTAAVERVCHAVGYFLNVLAVASGSKFVAAYAPGYWNYSQEVVYQDAVNYLNGSYFSTTFQGELIAELEDSISYETVMALQDLLGAVWRVLWDYCRSGNFWPNGLVPIYNYPPRVQALFGVTLHNAFAAHFEGMQGHLQAMFSLLFTWQFQYKPFEETRNAAASDNYKTIQKDETVYSEFDQRFRQLYNTVKAPKLTGRINQDVPRFAPWRTWAVHIPMPDAETQYAAAVKQAEVDAYNAKMAAIAAKRAQQKAEREARHEAERQALLDEIAGPNGANPLDPWDHRNWSRKQFWITPIHPDDVREFASNALDTPEESVVAEEVFKLNPKIVNGYRRLEPAINAVRDVVYPHRRFRRAINSTLIRRLLIRGRDRYKEYALDEIKENGPDRIKEALGFDTGPPEGRQFWPGNEPPLSPENPGYDPFDSTQNDFGGGTSGGGGAGRTW